MFYYSVLKPYLKYEKFEIESDLLDYEPGALPIGHNLYLTLWFEKILNLNIRKLMFQN